MLFDSWHSVAVTLVVGVLAYAAILLLLRVSGKRTLSKWNAFDFIVTVALGSSLATALLSKSTSLVQGVAAFAVLIGLQFVITWVAVRLRFFEQIVKAQPSLLVYGGKLCHETMRRERVSEAEVRAALRQEGIASLGEVGAVVLETDGQFSVIRQLPADGKGTLEDVAGLPDRS